LKKKISAKYIFCNLDTILAAAALVMLIFITFFGVIARYIISKPFAWEEEIQLALIVWVTFLGGRWAFIAGSHPAIDMVVDMFPKKMQRTVDAIITAVSVFILLYVGWQGWKYVVQMFSNHRTSNILHIPYALIYIVLPLGCVLMSLQMIIQGWKEITDRTAPGEGEE